jgi:hypothetical protein
VLLELVYYSNSTSPPADDTAAMQPELETILTESRRRNSERRITGLLLYHNREYIQLLEGEADDVRHVYYQLIARDRRHRAPTVCWESPVAARTFPTWSIGFARPAQLKLAPTPALDGYLANGVAGLDLSQPASDGRKLMIRIYGAMMGETSGIGGG